MEKLEKHIKKTLEERRIAPSSQAWERVSGQIKVADKPSGSRRVMYAVAASFIGIVLVSVLFYRTETPSNDTRQVVDNENPPKEIDQPNKNVPTPLEIEEDQTKIAVVEMEKTAIENSDVDQVAFSVSEKKTSEEIKNEPLKDGILNVPDGLISQKVNEVVAQVILLETMNNNVSDAEVDSLLRAAQQQILSEKLFDSDRVDAMALLTQVEDELDESFRDQIFDALKDGYFKLRTAVADRNN
ncbi:hypothetical protein [Flagellimonas sp.]|uniref:hypothetical protein n=1 Tax=Flagellimonas sp. TaxID=2058762 RepID=UPI003B50AB16